MYKLRSISLAALLTIAAFSAILYSSCTKSKCAGVTCENGGTCSGGTCSCASGFSGVHCELTQITYQNNTFTTVYIIINGISATIPTGTSVAFTGTPATTARGTAYTQGLYGLKYTWTLNDVFPTASNNLTDPLDVDDSYFFLQLSNIDPLPINYLTVNFGTPYQSIETVALAADRIVYGVGYYKLIPNTVISYNFSNGATGSSTLNVIPAINATGILNIL